MDKRTNLPLVLELPIDYVEWRAWAPHRYVVYVHIENSSADLMIWQS